MRKEEASRTDHCLTDSQSFFEGGLENDAKVKIIQGYSARMLLFVNLELTSVGFHNRM